MKASALIELLKEHPNAEVLIALGDGKFSPLAGFEIARLRSEDALALSDGILTDAEMTEPDSRTATGATVLRLWPEEGS